MDYGFLQLWTHASWFAHGFYSGTVYWNQVYAMNPRPRGYNIIGCHAADWAAGKGHFFLGGAYIYNNSATSLTLTSTTKIGGMLWANEFYASLGRNECMGEGLRTWFTFVIENGQELSRPDAGYDFVIGWHYGMMIIGDPMISFREVQTYVENSGDTDIPCGAEVSSYPNPTNEEANIIYKLPEGDEVKLCIFNSRGQLVKTLVNEFQPAGAYTVKWDSRDEVGQKTAAGLYLFRLIINNHQKTGKLIISK